MTKKKTRKYYKNQSEAFCSSDNVLEFWNSLKEEHSIEIEQAKRERALMYEQNRTLITKMEHQDILLEENKTILQEVINLQGEIAEEAVIIEKLKAKRAKAKKRIPRDVINAIEIKQLLKKQIA